MDKKVLILVEFPYEDTDGLMCESVAKILEEHARYLREHSSAVGVIGSMTTFNTPGTVRWDAEPPIP